jgi:hypothetical protein
MDDASLSFLVYLVDSQWRVALSDDERNVPALCLLVATSVLMSNVNQWYYYYYYWRRVRGVSAKGRQAQVRQLPFTQA